MEGAGPVVNATPDPMGSLLEQYIDTHRYRQGEIVSGVIASVSEKSILIDIGGKSDAIVHPREVERMSPYDLDALQPGQDVNVYVLDTQDDDGTLVVSLARAAQQDDWDRAIKLQKSGEPVKLMVVDINKGGVIVRLGKLRGFVPGSQLSQSWRPTQDQDNPDNRWEFLIGKTLTLVVIEVTAERNRLILSERIAPSRSQSKRQILETLKVGTVEKGYVNNVVPFGVFVNVKGVDGLLHVSELSWKRVGNPKEIVQVGQTLEVFILDIDLDKERLGLSLKRLVADPWSSIEEICKEGDLAEVTIVNLTPFGAFASLVERPELEGLIHISELSTDTVAHPSEVVAIGDRVTVKILSMRPEERRIAFSLKAARTVDVNP